MFKKMFTILIMFSLSLILTTAVYAANLSVRIEVPKTPTNQNNFKINFVAMDISGGAIDVKCFKKAPGDGSFSQFGSTINLSPGGNTGNCEVTSAIISAEGTYEFKVEATTSDSGTVPSSIVAVEYKTSAPGTPGDYRKEGLGSCQFKISFKTSDDGGKTSRVEVYRSDKVSFTADSSTRVGIVWIGSNLEGSFIDTVPDCGKGYYYVIRAFDGAGNGSGVTGDSVTKVTITSSTTTTQVSPAPTSGGAIPVSSSSVGEGQVLGEAGSVATPGAALGEATESAIPTPLLTPASGLRQALSNNFVRWVIVVIIAGGGYFLYRRFKS